MKKLRTARERKTISGEKKLARAIAYAKALEMGKMISRIHSLPSSRRPAS
ncbi:MAG: hypothetical protein ABI430_02400 [Candidatus Taylorbacteria bacterium]